MFGGTFSSDECDSDTGSDYTIAEQLSIELKQQELFAEDTVTTLKASIEAMLLREQELGGCNSGRRDQTHRAQERVHGLHTQSDD